ncbi:MAG: ribonuclease H [Deltaproteobacteria bacterium]
MPWKKMRLRADEVFAYVNEAGEPRAEGGRVQIRYRADATRAYSAAVRNLVPVDDARIYPESHCVAIDEATTAPAGPAPLLAPEGAPPPGAAPSAKKPASRTRAKKPSHEAAASEPVPSPAARKPPAKTPRAAAASPSHAHADGVIAYADGACTGNPGPAGLGVVVLDGLRRIERSEYLGHGTNNIAELTAILRALEAVPDVGRPLAIHTDSQYSIGVLSKGWKAKKNQTLIGEIKVVLARRVSVSLHYVPGHSGVPLNERADALARDAVRARETVETVHVVTSLTSK